jgi:hypothetical protein
MAIATYFWGLLIGVDKRFAARPDLKPKRPRRLKRKTRHPRPYFFKESCPKVFTHLGHPDQTAWVIQELSLTTTAP